MEIKIGKSSRACRATERDFVHGDAVVSLIRSENQTLVREDYGMDAWDESYAAGALAVWNTQYRDPKADQLEPPETFSPLRQVFYEAAVSEERLELSIAFLAAQLLRRQKVFRLLKEFDQAENETRGALYADRISDRLIEVRDPNLTYEELEKGREALLERLKNREHPEEADPEHAVVQGAEQGNGQE